MAFVENLRVFFADFGVIANGGTCTVRGASVEGIYDAAYSDALDMDGTHPMLEVIEADVPGIAEGAEVEVNGVEYRVVSVRPDGTGMVRLILSEA